VLGLIGVGLGARLGVGMLLGIRAYVLVRASTNCQDVLSNSKGYEYTLLSYTSASFMDNSNGRTRIDIPSSPSIPSNVPT